MTHCQTCEKTEDDDEREVDDHNDDKIVVWEKGLVDVTSLSTNKRGCPKGSHRKVSGNNEPANNDNNNDDNDYDDYNDEDAYYQPEAK